MLFIEKSKIPTRCTKCSPEAQNARDNYYAHKSNKKKFLCIYIYHVLVHSVQQTNKILHFTQLYLHLIFTSILFSSFLLIRSLFYYVQYKIY